MRLIDADAFKEWLIKHSVNERELEESRQIGIWIDAFPSAEPRKKGKWIWLSSTYDRNPCEMRYMCSVCHHETILHSNGLSYPWENYCANCGADMTGR